VLRIAIERLMVFGQVLFYSHQHPTITGLLLCRHKKTRISSVLTLWRDSKPCRNF